MIRTQTHVPLLTHSACKAMYEHDYDGQKRSGCSPKLKCRPLIRDGLIST